MAITPDDKDWTWVLERPCEECSFDAAVTRPADVADLVRANARAWQEILGRPDAALRTHPDQWSPLEYGCHVRDVFRIFDQRLERMLTEDGPDFQNWDQDATALEDDYASQDPARVAVDLAVAADAIAARFDTVEGEQWQRTGNRSDGARFTIATFSQYLIHDPVHHVWDVR